MNVWKRKLIFPTDTLQQRFSIPAIGDPCSAHFASLRYLTHLIEIISSLVQFMDLSPNELIANFFLW